MKDLYYSDRTISNFLGVEFSRCVTDAELNKIQKMSDIKISGPNKGRISGENNPMYGRKHNEYTKMLISQSHKGRQGNTNYRATPETKKLLSDLSLGENNHQFAGYYLTPWGKITTTKNQVVSQHSIRKWCKNSSEVITYYSYRASKYLKTLGPEIIGKTYADLGFGFEKRANGNTKAN